MRALRILLTLVVTVGVLFVIADRVAVHFAESTAADKFKTAENLSTTPDVSIHGFPFLTQLAAGTLDDVGVDIKDYEASTGTGGQKIRIDNLNADLKDVTFSGSFSSATAKSAEGTATISYAELLKAAQSDTTQIAPGVTAQVVGLSDGGNGKIKVAVDATVLGARLPAPVDVLSSVTVNGDAVEVHADSLPQIGGVSIAESSARQLTDFRQVINQLPAGIKLDKVQATPDGVQITVKGSNVQLAG
jgi:DUF2993 family protein